MLSILKFSSAVAPASVGASLRSPLAMRGAAAVVPGAAGPAEQHNSEDFPHRRVGASLRSPLALRGVAAVVPGAAGPAEQHNSEDFPHRRVGASLRSPLALRGVAEPLESDLFADFFKVPFPAPEHPKFTFIDLFAGIGGFRLAMQANGGKCVFSSEWNKFSQKTYMANFGEMPFGDITKEATKSFIPKGFDILCAGFPCQPFSIAGVAKKNSLGRPTGFEDKTQGTLFFDVAEILKRYRPKAFFLENVKNLVSHDKGNTFRIIRETLEELDYSIHYLVMDGKTYVPQHRERIMIVGFDRKRYEGKETFSFPQQGEATTKVRDILQAEVDSKYTLSDKLWDYLQNYAIRQKAKGNGFGFGMVDLDGITRTLSARYYKDGSEILIPQEGMNPRKLTPRECARLMGYPDNYIINAVSDVQAYRQCGNSVVVPLITAVAEQIVKTLKFK